VAGWPVACAGQPWRQVQAQWGDLRHVPRRCWWHPPKVEPRVQAAPLERSDVARADLRL